MVSARKPRPLGVQLTRLWPAMNTHNPITMPLGDTLQTIRTRLRSRAIANKAEVRQGVVLALLNELSWPFFDTGVVLTLKPADRAALQIGWFSSGTLNTAKEIASALAAVVRATQVLRGNP